ncbi:MAG: hypothetical protein KBC88_01820 [Alphaproteobacteria bacterium]|nr:hypothetical protein [Alphaproteobacteria bacterium]
MVDGKYGIKASINAGASFNEVAPDRVPMGTIRQEVGATITRVGMDGKSQTIDANTGDKVYKGDTLKTSDGGSFLVDLVDKTILTGGPNSAVEMSRFASPDGNENTASFEKRSISEIRGSSSASPTSLPKSNDLSQPQAIGVRG